MAVHLDDGGVDHGVFHVRRIRGGIEKPLENIGFYPVAIPLEARYRLKTVFQWPNVAGKSRQGLPVRAIHNTASIKRRLSAPLRPGSDGFPRQCGSIFAHWASVSTYRSIPGLKHTILLGKS